MTASMYSGASGAQTNWNQPDNSELSRFMNNGGGPEPHQGSNPGAQSDPGPKEVGFYDKATERMGGDDGAWPAVERPSSMRMDGSMGAETSNPVGSAASYDGEVGGEGYQGTRQSRAAQMLADAREDSPAAQPRDSEAYGEKPSVADKAGEVADSLKDKASGFFSRAVDRMEDFLDVDLNNDGNIGSSGDVREKPQAFETREKKAQVSPSNVDGTGGDHARTVTASDDSAQTDDSFSVFYGGQGETDPIMYDSAKKPTQSSVSARSDARQRELVGA